MNHNMSGRGLLAAVGGTPLVELTGRELPPGVRLFAKLESSNPSGSIKDRPASRILVRALERGDLDGGRRLLDSSSGNAGIAYAQFGAALGVGVTLVIPGNASAERLRRLRALGAELILTDPLEGYDFAILSARRLADEQPQKYWYADQYSNADNWTAHYDGTGREILDQVVHLTGAPPSAFVAGVGTGGTLTGVGRRLREADPGVHLVAAVPEIFPGIEGLKPLGSPNDIVPKILDTSLIGERLDVTSEEAANACLFLARQGFFPGPSSGAFFVAAERLAASGRFPSVVTVFSDSGERYASTGLWDEAAGKLAPDLPLPRRGALVSP